jgi:ribonuclease P protein component
LPPIRKKATALIVQFVDTPRGFPYLPGFSGDSLGPLRRVLHATRPDRTTEKTDVEAYISALEPRAQAPPRVPFAYGHQGWSQDPQRPPRPWPEASERLIKAGPMVPDTPLPGDGPPGAFSVLQQRADFLRAARAQRVPMPAFLLQARLRDVAEPSQTPIRVGFTCSKKVGNSVARNRAKRRLREIARAVLPVDGAPGWDYVLIGRADATATHPFEAMKTDLARALRKLHR